MNMILANQSSQSVQEPANEVGLAGLVEKQLARYINHEHNTLPVTGLYDRVLNEVERPLLRLVLNVTKGNRVKAAAILGLNRNTLVKKLREHGLDKPKISARQARRQAIVTDNEETA